MSFHSNVVIRRSSPGDIAACGKICYEAFAAINAAHNFPCDFSGPEMALAVISLMFNAPDFFCVVAEADGKILGSNCLDERSVIHGIGPITVDPDTQNRGVGRKLMEAVIERSHQSGSAGIRLVQAAFHNRSLSLYTSLGFDIREPLAVLQGRTRERSVSGCAVRAATPSDVGAARAMSQRVFGFDRSAEFAQSIRLGSALVVERGGQITGYTSGLALFGYTCAESNQDIQALLSSVDSFGGPGFLLPTRNTELFRWCLQNGLRVVEPMTLMSTGLYSEPRGVWLPSVSF